MTDHPNLESLVGDEPGPEERARLERVHELILSVDAPPELSPTLTAPPVVDETGRSRRTRRFRISVVAVAAGAALVLFGLGLAIGGRGADQPERTVLMRGSGDARARLSVFPADDAGNWPLELEVRGLEPLPRGEAYELWLTRGGRLVEQCGSFAFTGGSATVPMNAPYPLRSFSGWVVVRRGSDAVVLRTAQV